MKKFISVILAVVMVMSFAACGSKKDNANTLKEGTTLADVIAAVDAKFAEKYGSDYTAVAMGMPIEEMYLNDFLELDSSTYEEFAGSISMSMTNSDAFFVIKAKDGKTEQVQKAMEKRLADLVAQYEFYPVSGSFERAKSGEVYVKGDYVFLIVVGALTDENMDAPDFSADVLMTKETIDSMFNG